MPDVNGIWGMEYELDSMGRRISVRYLNNDGTPCANKVGVSSYKNKYNEEGILCEIGCYNLDGELTLNEFYWAICRCKNDINENKITKSYYGVNDSLCYHKNGYAKAICKYDSRGNPIEVSYYGVDNNLCYSKDGYSKEVVKYDSIGHPIEVAYYDINNGLCLNKRIGYAKVIANYNEDGNLIGTILYDEKGNILN